ncbi:MAG: DUF4363 family protein [Clostridia bacterium]
MIRIAISSACFLTSIVVCILGINHIENVIIPLIDQIELAISYSDDENFQKSSEIIEFSQNSWENSHSTLGILLRLNELDEIDDIFIQAIEYSKNGDSSSFELESRELIHRLEHLLSKEQLNFKNIF